MRILRLAVPAVSLPWLGLILKAQELKYPIGKVQAVAGFKIVADNLQPSGIEPDDHFQAERQIHAPACIGEKSVYSA